MGNKKIKNIITRTKREKFYFIKEKKVRLRYVTRDSYGRFIAIRSVKRHRELHKTQAVKRKKIRGGVVEVRVRHSTIDTNRNKQRFFQFRDKKKGYRYLGYATKKDGSKLKFNRNSANPYDTREHKGQYVQAVGNAVGTKTARGFVTDRQAYEEAYENLLRRINACFLDGSYDLDETEEYIKNRGWIINVDAVWYEEEA